MFSRKLQNRIVYIGKFAEMQPQVKPKRVFVAHPFFGGDTSAIDDYRLFLKDGLESIGYVPLFARDDSGTLLETICQDIIDTEAGIYDVTGYNANVLIELGMSIGLNQPTIVIAQSDDQPLITPLEQLNPVRYGTRYDLIDVIGSAVEARLKAYHQSGISPRFCAACGRACSARKPRISPEDEYLLVGVDADEDKAIIHHLKKAVRNFNLNWQELGGDFDQTMCRWTEEIRRGKLAFFHSREGTTRHSGVENAETMIRVGIAIGSGTAWRMILKQGERMPTDLEGYKYTVWHSSPVALDTALGGAVRQLLSETRPFGGSYDPLPPQLLVEDEETSAQEMEALSESVRPKSADETVLNERFRLIAQMGSNGAVVFYKAEDMKSGQPVAAKILRPSLSNDPERIARFRNEADLLRRLNHSNIVKLVDGVNTYGPTQYMVLDYSVRNDLKRYIKTSGAIQPIVAVEIALQICDVITYIHEQGLCNLDIKPQNILYTEPSQILVSDLQYTAPIAETIPRKRQSVVWGSPHYFSPETARGYPPAPPADIYQFGITLFELTTGKLPFTGSNDQELALAHIRERIPNARELNDGVPEPLADLVVKMMSKEPERRPTATAIKARLIELRSAL